MSKSNYYLLHPKLQKWIYDKNWQKLNDIQEDAISVILKTSLDVIISANTASGKTEAVLLPVISKILSIKEEIGKDVLVLYVSPLKALINDQFDRISDMCKDLDVHITPWHGDVSITKKTEFRELCKGILIITPESLEAMLMKGDAKINEYFKSLSCVVIDELHSFMLDDRGVQLISQLSRIENVLKKQIPRYGLSATIGDFEIAKKYLRSKNTSKICIVKSKSKMALPYISLNSYLKLGQDGSAERAVAQDIYNKTTNSNNLIFGVSKIKVERYADLLRTIAKENGVDEELYQVHHGKLSKGLREHAENAIKQKKNHTNIICTSTLEMGIDIGNINTIYQIGAPYSISSMRQRLGRSGRRLGNSRMELYSIDEPTEANSSVYDKLHFGLFEMIAMVELMLEGYVEADDLKTKNYSTFLHQIISLIYQKNGCIIKDLFEELCTNGAFSQIDSGEFRSFLKNMKQRKLIKQDASGFIHLDLDAEKMAEHYSFYPVFPIVQEYEIIYNHEKLGTVFYLTLYSVEEIIFAGKRWTVINIDEVTKRVTVVPSKTGNPFNDFGDDISSIDDKVRERMFRFYQESTIPSFLNNTGAEVVKEGRKYFYSFGLDKDLITEYNGDVYLWTWKGDKKNRAIRLLLPNIFCYQDYKNKLLEAKSTKTDLINALNMVADIDISEYDILTMSKNNIFPHMSKYSHLLSSVDNGIDFISKYMDIQGGYQWIIDNLDNL